MFWKSFKVREQLNIKEMYSFFEKEYEKGFSFQGEAHHFWECIYVQEGSILVSADERVYNLKEKEMIFHKPFEFHKFFVDCDKKVKLLIFSFSLEGELSAYFKNKVFVLSDEQKNILYSMLNYAKKKTNELDEIKEEEYRRLVYPFRILNTYSQMIVSYIYQLFLSLADNATVSDISHTFEAEVFKNAVDYMYSNIGKKLSVSEIAKFCTVSQASLKRIFEKYAGIGVHKYFLQIKIMAATKLLNNGTSVGETAELLGFSSQGYFSAAYKRETGKSPIKNKKS